MKQLTKKWYLWVLIFAIILAIVFFIIYKNNIANKILTEENCEATIEKYSSKNKETDNYYYFNYALMYSISLDGLDNLVTTLLDNTITYKNVYGKSINQLIVEGKNQMIEQNITVEEYKNILNELESYKNTINNVTNKTDEYSNAIKENYSISTNILENSDNIYEEALKNYNSSISGTGNYNITMDFKITSQN